jgi:hypothetical protein
MQNVDMKKETLTQDNFDPWTSLGLQTAMLLNRLRIQAQLLELQTDSPQNGVENDNQHNDRAAEQKKEEQRSLVERRFRGTI